MNLPRIFPCLVLVLFLILGCSGGDNPATPGDPQKSATGKSHLALHGFYTVTVDWAAGTLEAVPHRGIQDVLNVVGFLEPPPLNNLTIDFGSLEMDPGAGTVDVDVFSPIPSIQTTSWASKFEAWYSALMSQMPTVRRGG